MVADTPPPAGTVSGASVLRLLPWTRTTGQDDSVTFIAGSRVVRYSGGATRLLPHLLPRLDGRADVDSIVTDLGVPQLAEPVLAMCRRLHADGLVTAVDGVNQGSDSLFDVLADDGRAADGLHLYLAATADEYAAVAAMAPEHWRLSAVPLSALADEPWDEHTCAVVWVHDMNAPELADWNERAYRGRRRWLAIGHFDGDAAVVGPYIVPPQTACFECYRRRRASHSRAAEAMLTARPVVDAPLGTKAVTHVLAGLGMAMLHDWAARRSPFVPGAVRPVTFGEGLRVGTEYVLRVPRCGSCRPAAANRRLAPWSEYFDDEGR